MHEEQSGLLQIIFLAVQHIFNTKHLSKQIEIKQPEMKIFIRK